MTFRRVEGGWGVGVVRVGFLLSELSFSYLHVGTSNLNSADGCTVATRVDGAFRGAALRAQCRGAANLTGDDRLRVTVGGT